MNLDAGGIQTDHVYLDFDDSQLLQTQKCFFQNSLFRPAVYPDIDHVPISVFFGQAPPFAPIFHYVQRRIQYIQIADFCWFPLFRKALCDLFVLFFLQFHSLIIAYLCLCEQTLTGDTAATVSVKDTGIGIPPEYQARVFERFFRVDKSRSKASGGTGLGLSIVKHIAQYHHAEIKLHSGNGRGTIIEILFAIGEM